MKKKLMYSCHAVDCVCITTYYYHYYYHSIGIIFTLTLTPKCSCLHHSRHFMGTEQQALRPQIYAQ